jgi:flagellar biosynthetic protein FlhB
LAESNKTEKATPKKRRDERKKGNAFQSKDLISVVVLIVGFFILSRLGGFITEQIKNLYVSQLARIDSLHTLSVAAVMEIMRDMILIFAVSVLPLLILIAVTCIVMTGVQTRFLISGELIKFKFSRISIIQGFKRLLSLRSVVQLIKSLLKIILIIWIIYTSVRDMLVAAPDLLNSNIGYTTAYMVEKTMSMVYKICLLFVGVAILDYAYQKYDYEKKLRMTKQEVKDEYKQTEGDPFIKCRIREKQQKISMNRMIQQVPNADVVITNPTHFAVALKYDMERDAAPVVLAKGQDSLALMIIKEAKQHQVFVTENKPLARALYRAVEVNQYIPVEFYQAVAEVLAWVYSNKDKVEKEI